jgi:hypothetical protein
MAETLESVAPESTQQSTPAQDYLMTEVSEVLSSSQKVLISGNDISERNERNERKRLRQSSSQDESREGTM